MPITEGVDPPHTFLLPLMFRGGPPEFTAKSAGYNGPPYRAKDEYQFFVKHFRFRELGADGKGGLGSAPRPGR